MVRVASQLESDVVSVERVDEYTRVWRFIYVAIIDITDTNAADC